MNDYEYNFDNSIGTLGWENGRYITFKCVFCTFTKVRINL